MASESAESGHDSDSVWQDEIFAPLETFEEDKKVFIL
jgi:hypothetical protein